MMLDGTYNLINCNFVYLVFGTQTLDHKFKMIATSICHSENTECYSFSLSAIKYFMSKYF